MQALIALLLAWTGFFTTSNAAQENRPWITPFPNLDAAMEGYDPVMSNPLETPDPGIRNQIFQPTSQLEDKSVVMNSFVAKAHEYLHCDFEFTEKTLRNYNEYKTEKSSAHSFSEGADTSGNTGSLWFSFKASAGYGREENGEESTVKRFFQETKGEIIESKAQCITHATGIAPFEKPVFTDAFLTALRILHVAAKNPESENSEKIFTKFVASYGTHFMRTTFLGSKIVFEKLFVDKADNSSSESSRTRCVANSAYQCIKASFGELGLASTSFSRASQECGDSSESRVYFQKNGVPSTKIVSVGSLPTANIHEWASSVSNSPVPISYELDKISNLFTTKWFNTIPAIEKRNQFEKLNGTAMYEFFEGKSYCELMLGKECPEEEKGCGLNSLCGHGTTCVNDATKDAGYRCDVIYGGVIIAGGHNISNRLSDVESFNTWQPPSLTSEVSGLTLSVVGSKLYTCGGRNSSITNACYTFNRSSSSPSWTRYTNLPIAMQYHSEAVVGSHIWFAHSNQLFDLNTVTDQFKTYNLPLAVDHGHCAVSNETHSYIIGAGPNDDEIWVNTLASSTERWHKVAIMGKGLVYHACLWLNDSVYITGGGNYKADVEVFNTDTLSLRKTGSLDFGRHDHKMMVLDGEPAVVGGRGSARQLDNIETFDLETSQWKLSSRKLSKKLEEFGLGQLHE